MRRGKKAAKWDRVRAELKAEFERSGIMRCERCGLGMFLSFAHRLKRRFIVDDEELRRVALLCQACHEVIEHSGHDVMYDTITAIIKGR